MLEAIQDLERRKERSLPMGGQAMIDRQHSLGRYTAMHEYALKRGFPLPHP